MIFCDKAVTKSIFRKNCNSTIEGFKNLSSVLKLKSVLQNWTTHIERKLNKKELEITKLSQNPTRSGIEYRTQIRIGPHDIFPFASQSYERYTNDGKRDPLSDERAIV